MKKHKKIGALFHGAVHKIDRQLSGMLMMLAVSFGLMWQGVAPQVLRLASSQWSVVSVGAGASGLAVAALSGCAGKGQYNPSTGVYDTTKEGDPFVVNAQRTRGVAVEVFDGIMKIERENEAKLLKVNPAIHKFAEEIRKHGRIWLDDLSAAITAYQSNRTEDGKAKLNMALAVVASAVASAQNYLAMAK